MKALRTLLVIAVLGGGTLALACQLITAQQADNDALAAVGGGTVTATQFDRTKSGFPVYEVRITYLSVQYEVFVNGCTGAILKIVKG